MLKYSGYDAYELLRMSDRHESTLDMLRLFLLSDADRAAAGDKVKIARVEQINHDCKESLDESINTNPCANEAVTDAFRRLFDFLDLRPVVVLELWDKPPFLAQADQSFRELAIKSGVQFSLNYPGKV